MTLEAGKRLGPYEIQAPIGAGGMGEVYRAHDARLDRIVAIKVLPAGMTDNQQRRERFEREARAIAQLSHPHVCTLHDVGNEDGIEYLVMEYIEGETLSTKLDKSAVSSHSGVGEDSSSVRPAGVRLSLERALTYGIQIADALHAAHSRGIVHRDLKPSNIMVTRAGVKLLDFGLTKTIAGQNASSVGSDDTRAPTKVSRAALTGQMQLVGTLQYMAPEQLEGRKVDGRTDIFALGMILYELVGGRRPFGGESDAGIIAAILEHEPAPIVSARPDINPRLDRLILTCLAKDPEDRWQSAADIARELAWLKDEAAAGKAERQRLALRSPPVVFAATLAAAALVALAWKALSPPPKALEAVRTVVRRSARFEIPVTDVDGISDFAVAPDGSRIAYTQRDKDGVVRVFMRPLNSLLSTAVPGSDGAGPVVWSPDGRHVAFGVGNVLKRADTAGGQPRTVGEVEKRIRAGISWGSQGTILLASVSGRLYQVSAEGGSAKQVYDDQLRRAQPHFLPDGRRFLFSQIPKGEKGELHIGELDQANSRKIADTPSRVAFSGGDLLYAKDGAVLARAFDDATAELGPSVVQLADGIATSGWFADAGFSASADGVFVYRSGATDRFELTWFDRNGKKLNTVEAAAPYGNFDLSNDGRRIIANTRTALDGSDRIWVIDADRGGRILGRQDDKHTLSDPVWSPDGQSFVYSPDGAKILRADLVGNEPTAVYSLPGNVVFGEDWSRDGRYLAVAVVSLSGGHAGHIVDLKNDDVKKKPHVFGEDTQDLDEMHFSPDSRWIAYNAIYQEKSEVFLMPVPPDGRRWQVSTDGGVQAHFRADGRELFYLTPTGLVMAVDLDLSARTGPRIGEPVALFQSQLKQPSDRIDCFAVSPDGQRFLFALPVYIANASPMYVVLNWRESPEVR